MQEKLKTAEFELQQLKKERIFADIQSMMENAEVLSNGTKLVARFVEADAGLLKELTSKIIEKPGVIALMGTMNGEQAMYAFGRSADVNMDVGNLLRESARALGGKGGGKPEFAQGGGPAAILEAAVQKIKTIL
jgi:alanyl-tRNA synthetase